MNLEWLEKKAVLEKGGGDVEVDKQHEKGKLTARERLDLLFDQGTFNELGLFVNTDFHGKEFTLNLSKICS